MEGGGALQPMDDDPWPRPVGQGIERVGKAPGCPQPALELRLVGVRLRIRPALLGRPQGLERLALAPLGAGRVQYGLFTLRDHSMESDRLRR